MTSLKPIGMLDYPTSRTIAPGILLEPPIVLDVDDAEDRQERLSHLIADEVIPRLAALHNLVANRSAEETKHAGEVEIAELSRLVVGPDNSDAVDYVSALRAAGLSLDLLHIELLEPTARHLGDLWEADRLDFIDVTVGLLRLQRLVHVFAGLDAIAPYDDKRKALIVTMPEEQHVLGNAIVQRFFRAGGWYVCPGPATSLEELSSVVAREWFGVVGFSLSADKHLPSLAETIAVVRASSLNKQIGVMVGGPVFSGQPQRVADVGADGTAINAPAAVVLAKTLLAAGLTATTLKTPV